MNTSRVFSTLLLTFKEAVREKIFYVIVLFFLFLLGFNFILASLSGIEPEKILRDFGLAGVELSGLVAIIFFLVNSFYRDRQTKMLELFLSRSTREEFFLGKFLGYGLTIIFFIIISASSLCLVLFFKQALNSAILPAVWFTFLKLLIIISVVFLFSLLLSSPLLAAALGLGVYLCGSTSKAALEIIRMQTPPSQFQITAMKIYQFILPQLDKLEIKLAASYGRLPELSYLFSANLYALGYILTIMLISLIIFKQKEW